MKKLWLIITAICGLLSPQELYSESIKFVPQVKNIQDFKKSMELNLTRQCEVAPEGEDVRQYLLRQLNLVNLPIDLVIDTKLKNEEYKLILTPQGQKIIAANQAGLFNGAETFLSLLNSEKALFENGKITIPQLEIFDYPDLTLRAIDFQLCYTPTDKATLAKLIRLSRGLKLNYIVLELGPMVEWTTGQSRMKLDDIRDILKLAKESGLKVIPKINSLGHSDRGLAWVSLLGSGLDMQDEANYEKLFAEVRAWKNELAKVGLELEYFHFGMDEASDAMSKNMEKYQLDAETLLTKHMNKIADFAKVENIKPIIYHDMLLGSSEAIYWRDTPTPHSEHLKSYLARKNLDKSLIINYWNYEGFDRYRTLEGIHNEGFQVIFTPWAGSSVRKMAKNAALYGAGLIGSTWCDFTNQETKIPMNSIYNMRYVTDALVDVGEYSWNAEDSQKIYQANQGKVMQYLWLAKSPKFASDTDLCLKLGDNQPKLVNYGGILFDEANTKKLGNAEIITPKNPKLPISVMVDGIMLKEKINYFNSTPKFNSLHLFTSDFGKSTKFDIYSTEARVKNGQIFNKNDWGVGNTIIPANGVVISGWGEANYYLPTFTEGGKVRFFDADQKELFFGSQATLASGDKSYIITLKDSKSVNSLHLLHGTQFEGDLSANEVVKVTIYFADGRSDSRIFRYGIHLSASDNDFDITPSVDKNIWVNRAGTYGYDWILSKSEVISKIEFELLETGKNLNYLLYSLTLK